MSALSSVDLPEVRKFPVTNKSCYYGAQAEAAAYCGLDHTPENIRGEWQHGWIPGYWQLDPLMLGVGIGEPHPESLHYWVSRRDEADYLHNCGYKHVTAIGLPIVYLPRREECRRRPGSLLVMPAHSLEYTTHSWRFDEYADEIARIRGDFSEVVVCVHPACFKRGYWVDAFRKRGFQVVHGAMVNDLNALRRIRRLLCAFEYVTTNSFGSHVVYAAYFGAKVSVFGPYAEYRAEDFASDQMYLQHPHLLEPTLRVTSEREMRRQYPELFRYPREGTLMVEWGEREVGHDNKLAPAKLRALFRWRASDRVASKLRAYLPWRVKHLGRLVFEPGYRQRYIADRWLGRTRP